MFESTEEVKRIFIMLGNGCNCNCNYCLQEKVNVLPTEINNDVFDFIEQFGKIKLTFYGGEPLLYIDTIRTFLRKLRTKVNYGIITNGKAITKPIVDLLNRYNFNVTISWDGENSIKSRNYDVVDDKKDLLLRINNLGFSSVLNHFSYPKEILNDVYKVNEEYRKRHKNDINYTLDNLYNFSNSVDIIYNIDKEKLYNQIKDMVLNYNKSNSDIENHYVDYIKRLNNKESITFHSMCGNGIHTLNMDLQGNLYLCHNNYDKKLGTIYSDTDEYFKNYVELFNIHERFKKRCGNCEINMYCKGGCMLLENDNFNEYCHQRKAMFMPFVECQN